MTIRNVWDLEAVTYPHTLNKIKGTTAQIGTNTHILFIVCYRQLINNIMYKYLEIVKDEGNEVVKRLNVSDKSERSIEKIENGMNINLNYNEYTVQYKESYTELPVI